MSCDPQALGAQCHLCPLRTEGKGPVPTEHRHNADVLLVGSAPGAADVKLGRPFAGPPGRLLDETLAKVGLPRYGVSSTNVVLCSPPGGDLRAYERRLVARNRKRAKAGKHSYLPPSSACLPRLNREVRDYKNVIPLGAVALAALRPGSAGGISKNRGTVHLETDERGQEIRRLLPTLSPMAVLRDTRWLEVFEHDLFRAIRLFSGALTWQDPTYHEQPTVELLEELLLSGRHDYQWRGHRIQFGDVETNSIRAISARTHCIGVGTPDWVTVCQWWDIEQGRGQSEVPWPLHYSDHERDEIFRILRAWATRKDLITAGWNWGQYDRVNFEGYFGVTFRRYLDVMLLHKSAFPAYPHDLQFAGSQLLDITNWKGDHHGKKAPTNAEERLYNFRDVASTAMLFEPLYGLVEQRRQEEVIALDHTTQIACVGMHKNGMAIDQRERQRLEHTLVGGECSVWDACAGDPYSADTAANVGQKWRKIDGRWRPEPKKKGQRTRVAQRHGLVDKWTLRARKVLAMAGVDLSGVVSRTKKQDAENLGRLLAYRKRQERDSGQGMSRSEKEAGWALPTAQECGLDLDSLAFNPLSYPQIRAILFDLWELPPPVGNLKLRDVYTSSGEISTSDTVLRGLIMSDGLTKPQRRFIHCLRMIRRYAKLYGTYVRPMRLPTGDPTRDRGCRVWEDGRIHSNWNSHTPITGRFSSSNPNNQNWSKAGKHMIVAGPGRVFVGADMDQLELRIAAARWGASSYLEAFDRGLDPHQMTMEAVFGRSTMMRWPGAPSEFGRKTYAAGSFFEAQRGLAKQIQYASQYAATVETVFRLISSAEDRKTGELLYPDLGMDDVARMVEAWLRNCPEFRLGWAIEERTIEDNGIHPDERWGWIAEPVTGRRRDFYPSDDRKTWGDGGEDARPEPVKVNYAIQASAAGLMNRIMQELLPLIPFGAWGPGTGIVNQCHDAITVECPISEIDHVMQILTDVMNRREPAFPGVLFSSEADVGYRWADV